MIDADSVSRFLGANPEAGADGVAAWVAGQQLNLITVRQLLAAGMSPTMVKHRVRRGILHRRHQGVYLFGTDVMLPGGAELAGVLACGPRALARRRSATALFGLSDPWPGRPEVLVVGGHGGPNGIDVARVRALDRLDFGAFNGIPITSPALTLLHFAAVATSEELERAISEAYALRLVKESQLRDVVTRHAGQPGVRALRAELDRAGGPLWTASKAERMMKELLRKAELPTPQTRVRVAGFTADFLWPELRLIVEVDGYQYHGHRYAFERDHKRDQAHKDALYEVIRFTWRNLVDEPYRVVAVIAAAIGARRLDLTRAA